MDCSVQIENAKKQLTKMFPGITFTRVLVSPAYGMEDIANDYANMLAKGETSLSLEDLVGELKRQEKEMGDTLELRQNNVVMMDLDLLEYNGVRYHLADWERPYIRTLLAMLKMVILAIFFTCIPLCTYAEYVEKDRKQDAELLGKAMEYFQGGKYHESILLFEKLQKVYKLTPRYKAYLGLSYYKVMRYDEAVDNLKEGLPELTSFSPKEQAVYAYSCAESLFQLERYSEAIDYYNLALPMTEEMDKGDVLYHTAFSYFKIEKYDEALRLFSDSLCLYESYVRSSEDTLHKARLAQVKNMIRWLKSTLSQ